MKKLLTGVLLLLFAGALFAQESVYFQGSYEDAQKFAETQNKNLIVFFHSDG